MKNQTVRDILNTCPKHLKWKVITILIAQILATFIMLINPVNYNTDKDDSLTNEQSKIT